MGHNESVKMEQEKLTDINDKIAAWEKIAKLKYEIVLRTKPGVYDNGSQDWRFCASPSMIKDLDFVKPDEAQILLVSRYGKEVLNSLYTDNNWILLQEELGKSEYDGREIYRRFPVALIDGVYDYAHVKNPLFDNNKVITYYLLYKLSNHRVLYGENKKDKMKFISILDNRYIDDGWCFGLLKTTEYSDPTELIQDYMKALNNNKEELSHTEIKRCKSLLKKPNSLCG